MTSTKRRFEFLVSMILLGLSSCSAQQEPSTHSPNQSADQESAKTSDKEPPLARKIGTVGTQKILESSGLAISFHRADAFWTINDSGHPPHVYCLNQAGKLLATVEFQAGSNRDWESMSRCSIDGQEFLVVAEVGDNLSRYDHCRLYVFPEPKFELADTPPSIKVIPQLIEFNYEDGARDCEAVAIDPLTNDVWLFEKMMQLNLRRQPGVYRIPAESWLPLLKNQKQTDPAAQEPAHQRLQAKRVGNLHHPFLTGGEFSPDGQQLILRTYTYAIHFQKKQEESWSKRLLKLEPTLLPLPLQVQGEAIAFFPDSQSVLITSEGKQQPLWQIDLVRSLKQADR